MRQKAVVFQDASEMERILAQCKERLPEVWQRKNLAPVLEAVEGLKPGKGWERADQVVPAWKRAGLIKQSSRGMTFWVFTGPETTCGATTGENRG